MNPVVEFRIAIGYDADMFQALQRSNKSNLCFGPIAQAMIRNFTTG